MKSKLFTKGAPPRHRTSTKTYSSTGLFSTETRCFGWGKKLLLGAAGLAGGALLNNAMGDPLGISPYLSKAGNVVGGWLGNLGAGNQYAGKLLKGTQAVTSQLAQKNAQYTGKPNVVNMPDWANIQGTYTPSYGNSSAKQWWNNTMVNPFAKPATYGDRDGYRHSADNNDQYQMLDAIEARIKQNPKSEEIIEIDKQLKGIALNAKTPQAKQRAENLYKTLHNMPVDEKLEYNSAPPTSLQEIKAKHDDYKRYTEMLSEYNKLAGLTAKFQSSPYVNTPEGEAVFTEAKDLYLKLKTSPYDDLSRLAESKWQLIDALSKKYDGQQPAQAQQPTQGTGAQTVQDDPTPQMKEGLDVAIAKKDKAEFARIMTWMENSRAKAAFGSPIWDKINQLIAYARVNGEGLMQNK